MHVVSKDIDIGKNRAMHSDSGIAYILLQKIALMYRGIKHQETLQASFSTQKLNSSGL